MVMNPTVIFVVIVLLMCHAQISLSRPESSASLDTSVFELEDYEYHYDSDPYFPSSQAENNKNMGMKEAKMVDPWTLDFRRKLANRENIETFADKVASPQAQARMFLEEEENDEDNKESTTVEPAPTPEKLINRMGHQIPPVITEVPSIEVPTKFENLLDEPTIVFKSSSGTESRVRSNEIIQRLREKQTEMDRARERLRNRLSSATSTTTASPRQLNTSNNNNKNINDIKRPNKRPRPFSRLNEGQSSPTTTISALILASTTVPTTSSIRSPTSTQSVRDKMVAARNRLRVLMGQNPIGLSTTRRPTPTTPTPSAPTTMDKARMKILQKMEEKRKEEEIQQEIFIHNSTNTIDPVNATSDVEDPSLITVTAKSTIGDVQSEVNPLVLISPTFAPGHPQLANLIVNTDIPLTTTPFPSEDTTVRLPDDVLDVPTRMQDTLMRLMRKKGLKKDPFAKLVTTAVSLLDTDTDFSDLTPPTPKQDPFLTKNLSPGPSSTQENFEEILETPRAHQDKLLGQLKENDDGIVEGLSTPSARQNYLLRQLQANDDGVVEGLSTPSARQNYLLRQLQANDDGIVEGLSTPSARQNYLLRQLQANDDGIVEGLSTPSARQNYLLRQLQANDDGVVEGLSTPSARQNYLLRQLQAGHNENLELAVPSRKQNPLLRQLKRVQNEKIKGLRQPSRKQNPLLKSLKSGDSGEVEGIELPRNPLKDPLFRSEKAFNNRFNPDGLNLPNKRQNPLLRILRFDRRERILTKGLAPPRFKQNPLFKQLVQTPQKYRNDFLQLPPRQQNKLLTILKRHGGDNFNADALLTVPKFTEEDEDEYEYEYEDEEEEIIDDEDEEYEEYDTEEEEDYEEDEFFHSTSTTASPARLRVSTLRSPTRLRPIMPKNKFEVLQIRKPVEEVTFKRVKEPLTVKEKKEDARPNTIITTADPLIILEGEDFSTETSVPGLLLEPADNIPIISHPEFILNDQIPPATSLKPIPADAVEFTLQPETTTTTTTIVDIIPNLLHESSEEAEEVVSLHAHEILEDYYDELDQTTESGIPLETLELSPEFGSLNFEEFPAQESKTTFAPPPQISDEFTLSQIPDDNGAAKEENIKKDEFEDEMEKVIKIMKIAGNDLPASTFKTLMTDLVVKAKKNSESKEEEVEKVRMVGGLVHLFKEANAQRAQVSFEERKPDARPVQEQLEQVMENLNPPPHSPQTNNNPDLSQILTEKAKKKPNRVPDFNVGLEVPSRNPKTNQRPRLHIGKTKDFSHVLINKAKNRPSTVRDFESGLEVPVFIDKTRSQNNQQHSTPANDFLIEKAKSRPTSTQIRDFNSGILAVPALAEFEDDDEEFEDFAIDIPIPPEGSTLPPPIKVMNLSEILEMPKSKELIEDHIMDMIIESPDRAAADLAGLFDIKTNREKEMTEKELHQMMEKDPLAVTAAFTDLIIAQKSTPIASTQGPPVISPTTEVFEPVKIEDVPNAVKGKMERMKKRPPLPPSVFSSTTTTTSSTTAGSPNTDQEDVDVKIGSNDDNNNQFKTIEISSGLLDQMMRMIEDGQLSHREVIEEMINNGLLPVEVTEIGKIPIVVGSAGGRESARRPPVGPRNQPLVRQRLPAFRDSPPREEINLVRLKELKHMEPQMTMRDHHDFIKEVDIQDPDFDFEMVELNRARPTPEVTTIPSFTTTAFHNPIFGTQPSNINFGPNPTPESIRSSPLVDNNDDDTAPEEKDIEILSSMMDLYEQGLISDQELETMVIMMEKEGVLDVDLKELGIGEEELEEIIATTTPMAPPNNANNNYAIFKFNPISSGPAVDDREPMFGFKEGIRPFADIDSFTLAEDELNKSPFIDGIGETNTNINKPSSYSSFTMGRPRALPILSSTPRPPTLPPPSPESVHNAPFFEDLRMNNPFELPFEDDFQNANMAFEPKPTKESSRLEFENNSVKPGPAPPHWLSAKLPAPPKFRTPESEFEFLPITPPSSSPPRPNLEGEMFESTFQGGGEPFPPPTEFKRHVHHQPLPLILHAHEGQGFEHPHFDIPDEILNPESFYRSPRRIPPPPPSQPRRKRLTSAVPERPSYFSDFLPRQGRLATSFSHIPIPFVDGLPGITGLREVDRRLDRIRKSYLQGDGMGSATDIFEKK